MANQRKKKTIIEEVLPDNNETENNDDISDIIVTLSKVYKSNNGRKSFCFQSEKPVDEVELQTQYPTGGSFIVYEYNGLNQLVNTMHYDIEPKSMVNVQAAGNASNGTEIQIRMLFDELNWTRQMLMQQLTNNKSNGGVLELVQALQGIHSLAPAGKDPIELLIKGMELGSKNSGAGDWKTELLQTAKEVIPPALQAISMQKQIPDGNGNGYQPMIAASSDMMLKQSLQWIKSRIIAGMDTGLAVSWIIQNANDPQYQPLLSKAIQGNLDSWIEIDPELGNEPYRTWFTTALNQIKDWYAEQQQIEVSNDMDGGIGDSTDTPVNEAVSSRKSKLAKIV